MPKKTRAKAAKTRFIMPTLLPVQDWNLVTSHQWNVWLTGAFQPAMDTHDFESCVEVHAETLRSFGPDVLVGSSFGAGVVVALLQRGLWRGPTLLLAQAALRRMPEARLPAGVPVWLVHGTRDALIDPEESRRLARTGEPERVRLIEVDDDHSLHASSASGRLAELVRELAAQASQR